MSNLETLIKSFSDIKYRRVTRGPNTYNVTLALTKGELEHYVKLYHQATDLQELRLLRDAIDHWIRRYHGYCIQGSIGSHYVETGAAAGSCIFEHVVPASKIRDMLIAGVLTIDQALNMPTCIVSKSSDQLLRYHGFTSYGPDYWNFFSRYNVLNTEVKTHDGKKTVNLTSWTLQNHFDFFGIV